MIVVLPFLFWFFGIMAIIGLASYGAYADARHRGEYDRSFTSWWNIDGPHKQDADPLAFIWTYLDREAFSGHCRAAVIWTAAVPALAVLWFAL